MNKPTKNLNKVFKFSGQIVKVVDGDTIDCRLDLGFGVYKTERIRLARINAPEMSTKEGKASKQWLVDLLPEGTEVSVETHKSDIYGRYIGEVIFNLPNQKIDWPAKLNDYIVEENQAIYQKY
jgi:endonuclease YncB( thermonuclease family)